MSGEPLELWDDTPPATRPPSDAPEVFVDRAVDRAVAAKALPWMQPTLHQGRRAFRALVARPGYQVRAGILGYTQAGLKASGHFNAAPRTRCGGYDLPSPFEAWLSARSDGPARRKLIACAARLGRSQPFDDRLLRAVTRLSGACHHAVQFKPAVAAAVIRHFGARAIFDPCAGWGDRLLGFCASPATTYVGADPNPAMTLPYQAIAKEYGPTKTARVYPLAFEDLRLSEQDFDLALTSPPYFDIERYEGPAQSWRRYPTWQGWLTGFLEPLMVGSVAVLRPGGVLAINVKDKVHRKGHVLADITGAVRSLAEMLGLIPLPALLIEMKSKPGDQGQRPGGGLAVYEPIFCWRKRQNRRPPNRAPSPEGERTSE